MTISEESSSKIYIHPHKHVLALYCLDQFVGVSVKIVSNGGIDVRSATNLAPLVIWVHLVDLPNLSTFGSVLDFPTSPILSNSHGSDILYQSSPKSPNSHQQESWAINFVSPSHARYALVQCQKNLQSRSHLLAILVKKYGTFLLLACAWSMMYWNTNWS